MIIRDLTLRSAASFGSFHLIRLLYDEYMFYLVEHEIAKFKKTTCISVMSEITVEFIIFIIHFCVFKYGVASNLRGLQVNLNFAFDLLLKSCLLSTWLFILCRCNVELCSICIIYLFSMIGYILVDLYTYYARFS